MRWLGLLTIAISVTGCLGKRETIDVPLPNETLRVVATTGMVADVVKRIGADAVRVEALMGPGVDPHLYKASTGDVAKLSSADVVFYNGLHLEGKMAEVLEQVGRRRAVATVTRAIPASRLLSYGPNAEAPDPHVWFDVSLWLETLDPVVDVLSKLRPDRAEAFRAQADAYRAELEKLHSEVAAEIASIPKERRLLVTAHDAFRYFGRAYDIEVLGIQGISTETEAGLAEINRLVDVIVRRGVRAVFVETSVSDKNVRALIEGARRRGADVRIGGSLFSDAMGAAGTPEGTYPGMVRHNVRQIVEALR